MRVLFVLSVLCVLSVLSGCATTPERRIIATENAPKALAVAALPGGAQVEILMTAVRGKSL